MDDSLDSLTITKCKLDKKQIEKFIFYKIENQQLTETKSQDDAEIIISKISSLFFILITN